MNLARVSSNGQIIVPIEIRHKLNIKEGDKVIFYENANGEIILRNSSKVAIREAQAALEGIEVTEEDILQDIMELRYSKGDKKMRVMVDTKVGRINYSDGIKGENGNRDKYYFNRNN